MSLNHGFDQISSCPNCRIRAVELFDTGDLDDASGQIANMTEARSHKPGDTLFEEGDSARGIFLIDAGRLKLIKAAGKKREVIKIARHGDVLGVGATLTNRPHRVTAEALADTSLRFLPAASALRFLKAHPMVLGHIVTYLEQHVHQEPPPFVPTHSARKLANYLLEAVHREGLGTDEGTRLDLPVTLRELSWVLHIRPERLEDVMNRFEDRRWLYRGPRSVTVLDEAGLASVSKGV